MIAEPTLLLTPEIEKNNNKIIESISYILLLENNEYELTMSLIENNLIQYKLIQKNTISSSYYIAEYDLSTINKLLFVFFKDIKEIYNFYDKILKKNKVKLILSKEKNKINLNFKNIINFDEEVETNLELKEIKLNKDEILNKLINEVILLKTQIKNKENNENKEKNEMKEYINKIINEIKNENKQKNNNLENKIIKLEQKINENELIYENKINNVKKEYEDIINNIKNEYEERINNIKMESERKINETKNENKEKIIELEKNINILLEEYKKNKKKKEEKEKEKEKEEKLYSLKENDNVNLINDFKCQNINNLNNINNINNLKNILLNL